MGPNGCGKSNIVDALRWVMGEQSPRHLRGHLMEDVIFNGSESVAPTGMAEVSLVLDNEDGRGPAEYSGFSEIMITRRLFRSGESEYAINKVPCRLKDIIELFLGTGIGNKAYSIVEQGRVDEMVNAKPEERRALIEEAAGTSKYKSRKLVAERKLERTHQNLLRVSDIVREIERQIRSMELQAKKAERYRSLKSELKEKEIAWSALQKRTLDGDIAEHEAKLREVEDRMAHLFASIHAKEAQSEETRASLLEAETGIAAQQEAVYHLRVQVQTAEQKIDFYRKDLSQLEEAEKKTRLELLQIEERLCLISEEIKELQKSEENFIQLSLFEESHLRERESEWEKTKQEIQSLRSAVESEKQLLIELWNQAAQLKNELIAKERSREESQKELSRSKREAAETAQSLQSWEQKRQEKKRALDGVADRVAAVERESATAAGRIEEYARLREVEEKKRDVLKDGLQETRSRIASLEALTKNYEGVQEGVRAIMRKRQSESAFDGVYGLVADVIDAPETFEKALTAVLGERLQYVIVRSHEEGMEAIEYLKHESSGRGSFIPRQLSRKEHHPLPLSEPESVAPLLEKVSVKKGYQKVAEYLLGDVLIVRDLKSGLDLWNRNGFVCSLVTPEGEVIDSMGVVTGGSADSLEASLISQRRRLKESETLQDQLEAALKGEEREIGALKERLDQIEKERSARVDEGHALALEKIRLEHDLLQADQEARRLTETLRVLDQEQKEVSAGLGSLADSAGQVQEKIDALLNQRAEAEKLFQKKQDTLSRLEKESERLEKEVAESRIRGVALGEKQQSALHNLEGRMKFREELSGQVQSRKSEIEETKTGEDKLKETILLGNKALIDDRKKLKELEGGLAKGRESYKEVSRRLVEMDESVKEMRPLAGAAQEERNRIHLLISEKRLHLQHLLEGIREKYSLDLSEMPAEQIAADALPEDLTQQIEELRGRLERIGEVNLAAIGEFEELNSRYQFLSQQKQDLEQSMADLQRTIVKLNRVCRLRFRESFEEINQRFEEIFPRLFRGGKARLVLTDENDYLETGVEIVAQPPGKKLQSVTLLSGGEKALTAVSLLFAIFLTKPSPFCFLDEVDAPLDDANIDRFNGMIKEMSQSSQFVLITHNKRTMQAAEVLYGITMAEPGVSKVVSVRMS